MLKLLVVLLVAAAAASVWNRTSGSYRSEDGRLMVKKPGRWWFRRERH